MTDIPLGFGAGVKSKFQVSELGLPVMLFEGC